MRKKALHVADLMKVHRLALKPPVPEGDAAPSFGPWIRLLRTRLRMTQSDLAKRAGVGQSHVAALESGKVDPQISTLQKVFAALGCGLLLEPQPRKDFDTVLRERAQSVALYRLKRTMGTMALENQAPNEDVFQRLLESKTNEILADQREDLWKSNDE